MSNDKQPETFEEWVESLPGGGRGYELEDAFLAGQRSRDAEVGELEREVHELHSGKCFIEARGANGEPIPEARVMRLQACRTCRKVLGGGE